MTFRPGPSEPLVPIAPHETVEPTRVAWMLPNGILASRVFPTRQRAFAFAQGLVARPFTVQPAAESPPRGGRVPKRSWRSGYVRSASGGR